MPQYPPQPPQGPWRPSGPLSPQDPRKLQEPPQWQGPPPQPNTSYQQPSGPQWPQQQPFYTQPNNYQQQQPQYQYQQPPMMPPPGPPQPPKKKLSRRTWIMIGGGVLVLIMFNAIFNAAKGNDTPVTAAPTAVPTTIFVNSQATATPPPKPKVTQVISSVIIPTHGTPHLGGPISDFYGKYGSHLFGDTQTGSAPSGQPETTVAWVTDSANGYLLSVDYYTSTHAVYSINYTGPSSWSKAQYRDYLIVQFAPSGTVENSQANQWWASQGGDPYNPIAYTSSIGKFFLHISDGNGYMNTV